MSNIIFRYQSQPLPPKGATNRTVGMTSPLGERGVSGGNIQFTKHIYNLQIKYLQLSDSKF